MLITSRMVDTRDVRRRAKVEEFCFSEVKLQQTGANSRVAAGAVQEEMCVVATVDDEIGEMRSRRGEQKKGTSVRISLGTSGRK